MCQDIKDRKTKFWLTLDQVWPKPPRGRVGQREGSRPSPEQKGKAPRQMSRG